MTFYHFEITLSRESKKNCTPGKGEQKVASSAGKSSLVPQD